MNSGDGIPGANTVDRLLREAERLERITRPHPAIEAAMREAERVEKLIRPNLAFEAALRHAEQIEKLTRPHPAIEAAMREAEGVKKLIRPNPAFEAALRHAEQLEKLMRPSAAVEAAMRQAEQMEKLMRPHPAIEAAIRHAEQLKDLMRPSIAFQESVLRAASLEDLMNPARVVAESLRRSAEFAAAIRAAPAFTDPLRHTRQLIEAAAAGSALRNFIREDSDSQTASGHADAQITSDQTELIVSREIDADALFVPANKGLVSAYAPSLLALRRLFSKDVDLARITWRELEEIVAELLSFEGYDVQLGRGTKDNGVDVLASKVLPHVGLLRTVWQAKHLRAGKKVQLSTIRELADIRDQAGATKGVIVTTGFLTSGALRRIRQEAYRLQKIDGGELEHWIRRTLKIDDHK